MKWLFERSEDSANPATEVLRAVRSGAATIPDSLLLAIQAPPMPAAAPCGKRLKTIMGGMIRTCCAGGPYPVNESHYSPSLN